MEVPCHRKKYRPNGIKCEWAAVLSDDILWLQMDERGTAFINVSSQTCGSEVMELEDSEMRLLGFVFLSFKLFGF